MCFIGEMSETFECKASLIQIDALPPMLFNLSLEKVIRDSQEKRKMELVEINTILAYAYDITIIETLMNKI